MWGAVNVSCHEWNVLLFIISMRLLVPSMKNSPLWRRTRWRDAPACKDLEPNWGELQLCYFHPQQLDVYNINRALNLIWCLPAVALCQDLSSGWRWRPLSACCGECVKVTPSSATQKWMRALLISTLWVQLHTSRWGGHETFESEGFLITNVNLITPHPY